MSGVGPCLCRQGLLSAEGKSEAWSDSRVPRKQADLRTFIPWGSGLLLGRLEVTPDF